MLEVCLRIAIWFGICWAIHALMRPSKEGSSPRDHRSKTARRTSLVVLPCYLYRLYCDTWLAQDSDQLVSCELLFGFVAYDTFFLFSHSRNAIGRALLVTHHVLEEMCGIYLLKYGCGQPVVKYWLGRGLFVQYSITWASNGMWELPPTSILAPPSEFGEKAQTRAWIKADVPFYLVQCLFIPVRVGTLVLCLAKVARIMHWTLTLLVGAFILDAILLSLFVYVAHSTQLRKSLQAGGPRRPPRQAY